MTHENLPQESPLFNRAQRRLLHRYIRHAKNAQHLRQAQRAAAATVTCPRCALYFFVPQIFRAMPGITVPRCQCQVEQRRQCRLCGVDFMASQQAWRYTNACLACAAQIAIQRENEEASADEAARRRYDVLHNGYVVS